MIALQFRRVHSVEVVGPRSLNSTPLRSMWSRQEQINAPYTLPRQRESGRNRPYGCSMPPTSRPHFRVGSMIHRTVFDMPVTGPDPAVAPEKMPAWTHPKTPRGDRDLKGKWAEPRRSTRARERWRCRCGAIPTIESTSTPVSISSEALSSHRALKPKQ